MRCKRCGAIRPSLQCRRKRCEARSAPSPVVAAVADEVETVAGPVTGGEVETVAGSVAGGEVAGATPPQRKTRRKK